MLKIIPIYSYLFQIGESKIAGINKTLMNPYKLGKKTKTKSIPLIKQDWHDDYPFLVENAPDFEWHSPQPTWGTLTTIWLRVQNACTSTCLPMPRNPFLTTAVNVSVGQAFALVMEGTGQFLQRSIFHSPDDLSDESRRHSSWCFPR